MFQDVGDFLDFFEISPIFRYFQSFPDFHICLRFLKIFQDFTRFSEIFHRGFPRFLKIFRFFKDFSHFLNNFDIFNIFDFGGQTSKRAGRLVGGRTSKPKAHRNTIRFFSFARPKQGKNLVFVVCVVQN